MKSGFESLGHHFQPFGFGKVEVYVTGAVAGDVTVTGISKGDLLTSVKRFSSAGALEAVVTSEFSITAANTINNTGGTSSATKKLLIEYIDMT